MKDSRAIEQLGSSRFRGRVNRKLALLLGISLIGVLLLGGMSTFFAWSIYLAAEEISQEQQESQTADRIHTTFHHFIFALQRSVILSRPVPEGVRAVYSNELKELLAHERGYHRALPERKVVEEIRRKSSELFRLSAQLEIEQAKAGAVRNRSLLDDLDDFASDIQTLAHSLSAAHQARMDRLLAQNQSSMEWIFLCYAIFFLVGALLVVGASFYFGHTIARPLRTLSRAAEEVAEGRIQRMVPVESTDEIGLLSHTFNLMVGQLGGNEAKLRQLTILEERDRIAGELHDSLAQSLALLNLKLGELEAGLGREDARFADVTLNEMRTIVGDTYNEVREAIFGLRAETLGKRGFIPALAHFVKEFSAMRKIQVDLNLPDPAAIQLSPHAEMHLIRIVQEALTNVSKHAQATKTRVRLERDGDYANILIEDDGKGFSADGVKNSGLHFGLKTMRERAQAAGGEFRIESQPGKGAKISVRLPLERNRRHVPD